MTNFETIKATLGNGNTFEYAKVTGKFKYADEKDHVILNGLVFVAIKRDGIKGKEIVCWCGKEKYKMKPEEELKSVCKLFHEKYGYNIKIITTKYRRGLFAYNQVKSR